MGLLGTLIITLMLSSPLHCQRVPRQAIASLLQNILGSNPQVLKMLASRQNRSPAPVNYSPYGPLATTLPGYATTVQESQRYVQAPAVIDVPYPVVQTQVTEPYKVQSYANYPVAQAVPVKEAYQVQKQYPVTQQVQTVSQTYTAPGYPGSKPYIAPASMVNPFLPAASPISALIPPTSNLLPPANPTLSRSHFLRKIPIPPPCL